ncbi:MAG TPA: HAMP domain-containing sensor histidine kinase, partial [Stellaceae bacterium]|nr:HAMP domain-containing sensor histidine kinase [Stellaceae bacterium]
MKTTDAVEDGPPAAASQRHRHDPSVFATFERWLAAISPVKATAVLTGIALVLAEILHVVIGLLIFPPVRFDTLASGAMVAILVSVPIVFRAQMLIRKLVASRQTLKRLTENLAMAVHEAEAANEGKSRFLANMSHELRTPLNAIIGFSDILRDETFGPLGVPRYRQYAADISTSGAHLLSIINDMLDLTRITAGKAMVDVDGECELGDVVGTTLPMVETLAKKQEVTVERELLGASIIIIAAERMVRQILLNILSNAVKFTPPGGRVTLSAKIQESGELV